MNAIELSEKLKQRRQELESTKDWIQPNKAQKFNKGISVKFVYGRIGFNVKARDHLGLKKGDYVRVEFSASQKVLRFTKSNDLGDFWFRADYQISAFRVYQTFGLNVLPSRDMPGGRSLPPREAIVFGDSLIVDVADLIESENHEASNRTD